MHLLSSFIASAGVSFGLTAFTVLSVRSENDVKQWLLTFAWTLFAITGIFAWIQLPGDLSWQISIVGAAVGGFCLSLLLLARYVERKYRV